MSLAGFFRVYTVAAAKAASSITDVGISEADKNDCNSLGNFNVVYVINNSNQIIAMRPDGSAYRDMIIPPKFAAVFDVLEYQELAMVNYDTANATDGAVYVTVVRM